MFYRTHHLDKSCPFGEKRVFSKRFSMLVIEVVNLERRHDRMEGTTSWWGKFRHPTKSSFRSSTKLKVAYTRKMMLFLCRFGFFLGGGLL